MQTCIAHSRDTIKKLKSGQKEMDRLPLHSERICAMVTEWEQQNDQPEQGDAKRAKLEA